MKSRMQVLNEFVPCGTGFLSNMVMIPSGSSIITLNYNESLRNGCLQVMMILNKQKWTGRLLPL